MRQTLRTIAILFSLALCLPAMAQQGDGLLTLDGQPASLQQHVGQGKWLVVMFWAHDCHVCNVEAEGYAMFHAAHADNDASVLGVSIDGLSERDEAQAFIDRHDLPFPNLIAATTRDTLALYTELTGTRFVGTPSILLFDPQGELRAAQAGAVPVDAIEAYMARATEAAGSK